MLRLPISTTSLPFIGPWSDDWRQTLNDRIFLEIREFLIRLRRRGVDRHLHFARRSAWRTGVAGN